MAIVKRLIDANALVYYCKEIAKHEWNKRSSPVSWSDAYEGFIDDIDEMPTVDAVEVPCRCKECKYWRHYDHLGCTEFVKVCTLAYYMIGENGYCLYGAKMDGGNENG